MITRSPVATLGLHNAVTLRPDPRASRHPVPPVTLGLDPRVSQHRHPTVTLGLDPRVSLNLAGTV